MSAVRRLAAVIVLTAIVAGCGGGSSATKSSPPDTAAAAAAAPAEQGSATGASTNASVVPTPSIGDATAVALRWVASTGELLKMGPIARSELLRQQVASTSAETMTVNLNSDLDKLADGLPIPASELRLVETPLTGVFASELDVFALFVLDDIPTGAQLVALDRALKVVVPADVWVTWMFDSTAQRGLRVPGDPLTEVAAKGTYVAGIRLPDLVDDAAEYDASAVSLECHRRSGEWVRRLRNRELTGVSSDRLALILRYSASAALMHHRMGHFDGAGSALDRGVKRLGNLIGSTNSAAVGDLVVSLEGGPDPAAANHEAEVRRLVDLLLQAASDPAGHGVFVP